MPEPDSQEYTDQDSDSGEFDLDLRLDDNLAATPPPASPPAEETANSPYAARPAAPPPEIPAAQDRDQLRFAASAMLQRGLSLDEAAKQYSVDTDTLHIWHRAYINFVGKDMFAISRTASPERIEFDAGANQKFNENWDEMIRLAELERPQMSPLRKNLLSWPLTRWMFRDDRIDPITIAGAGAVIAFTALAIKVGTGYRGDADDTTGTKPSDEIQPADINPADPESYKGDQQEATLALVADALDGFAKLESWQERLPFIRNPETVKPLMAAYYEKHADGPLKNLQIDSQVSFIKRNEGVFVLLQGMRKPDRGSFDEPEQIIFLAELREEKPKVLFDWEVMVNYSPIGWSEFVATRSQEPNPFRVRVVRGDYFNMPFMDSDKYLSFALMPLYQKEIVYGFVEKGTPLALALDQKLSKELNQHRAMILELRFPDGAKFDNILQIKRLVSDGWLEEEHEE